jgi:hypothetical protein
LHIYTTKVVKNLKSQKVPGSFKWVLTDEFLFIQKTKW